MLNSIHSDLIRGHIDTIILSVLHEGDRYGYDILGEIERKSNGEYVLKQPTLYSCLKRLETQGFIYKYWGTETNGGRRTYYSLTEMGKELFQRNKDKWKYSRGVIDKLISTPEDPYAVYKTIEVPVAADSATASEFENTINTNIVNDVAEAPEYKSATEITTEDYAESVIRIAEIPPTDAQSDDTPLENYTAKGTSEEKPLAQTDAALLSEYANVLAEAEKDEMLTASNTDVAEYENRVKSFSYADRLTHDTEDAEKRNDETENDKSIPFFAHDYFSDREGDQEDEDELLVDSEIIDDERPTVYPTEAFYKDEDFSAEESGQLSMFADQPSENKSEQRRTAAADENNRTASQKSEDSNVFKRYDNAELSEETNREIVVGREYLGVIKRLLSGDTDADTYYSRLREVGATTATLDDERPSRSYEEQPPIVTETPSPMETEASSVNFDDLLVSVRSMGDEIRIRTHNRAIDKEYNSLYHYYSNKLLLFKYGILFALMILEIVIPYFVIKFGLNISPIAGELPVLVISVVGAALLPIYAISSFLIDPYKRKRYDFDLKHSLLYRSGIMVLMLILVYAVNVVFYMDISMETEYAFSLITPALLSTNIPISALAFKGLYDSKHFCAE